MSDQNQFCSDTMSWHFSQLISGPVRTCNFWQQDLGEQLSFLLNSSCHKQFGNISSLVYLHLNPVKFNIQNDLEQYIIIMYCIYVLSRYW